MKYFTFKRSSRYDGSVATNITKEGRALIGKYLSEIFDEPENQVFIRKTKDNDSFTKWHIGFYKEGNFGGNIIRGQVFRAVVEVRNEMPVRVYGLVAGMYPGNDDKKLASILTNDMYAGRNCAI